jgi:hypothetical protein
VLLHGPALLHAPWPIESAECVGFVHQRSLHSEVKAYRLTTIRQPHPRLASQRERRGEGDRSSPSKNAPTKYPNLPDQHG